MDKRKLNRIVLIFLVLTLLVVGLMLRNTLRRSSHIILPETVPTTEQVPQEPEEGDALSIVEIKTDTVQAAIATLSRPDSYRRNVNIEQLWVGGSGSFKSSVSVKGPWTRTDRILPDGQSRHTITDEHDTYIWYNDEAALYRGPAGEFSADNEQSIPTYETVLALPAERIAAADYRDLSGLPCIYVETTADEESYRFRYWVSVDTGLLVSAEKLLGDRIIYRMSAPEVDLEEPEDSLFVLPDGSHLL